MAVSRVIRMDVCCVKTHCLLSLHGGYDHRGVNVRGEPVGDSGKEIVKHDSAEWQKVYFPDESFSKALAIRSKCSVSGAFLNCCGTCFILSCPERCLIN